MVHGAENAKLSTNTGDSPADKGQQSIECAPRPLLNTLNGNAFIAVCANQRYFVTDLTGDSCNINNRLIHTQL